MHKLSRFKQAAIHETRKLLLARLTLEGDNLSDTFNAIHRHLTNYASLNNGKKKKLFTSIKKVLPLL